MSHSSAVLGHEPKQPRPVALPAGGSHPAGQSASPAADVGCPMCGNLEPWGNSSWCPQCGFYPRLGISLGPALKTVNDTPPAPKSTREVWQRAPVWVKVLGAGMLGIFVASVAARLALPEKGLARTLTAVLQLVTGLGVAVTMHAAAFFKAAMTNHRFGLIDALLHPIETWKPTIEELPKTARRVWLGAWGLTAAVCAVVVVGGIRYAALVDDWGFRNRVRPEMESRIRVEAAERLVAGGALAGDLEEKIQERAEQEAREAAIREKNGTEFEILSADCVVIGYNLSAADGAVSELLLASLVDGELKYVGSVKEGIPEDVKEELSRRLPELKRETAFVNCSGSGIWVQPVIACKTAFKSWTEEKTLNEVKFKELLDDIGGVK